MPEEVAKVAAELLQQVAAGWNEKDLGIQG